MTIDRPRAEGKKPSPEEEIQTDFCFPRQYPPKKATPQSWFTPGADQRSGCDTFTYLSPQGVDHDIHIKYVYPIFQFPNNSVPKGWETYDVMPVLSAVSRPMWTRILSLNPARSSFPHFNRLNEIQLVFFEESIQVRHDSLQPIMQGPQITSVFCT